MQKPCVPLYSVVAGMPAYCVPDVGPINNYADGLGAGNAWQVFGSAAGVQAADPAFAAAELLQAARADGLNAFAPDRRSVVGQVHARLLDLVRLQPPVPSQPSAINMLLTSFEGVSQR